MIAYWGCTTRPRSRYPVKPKNSAAKNDPITIRRIPNYRLLSKAAEGLPRPLVITHILMLVAIAEQFDNSQIYSQWPKTPISYPIIGCSHVNYRDISSAHLNIKV